MSRRIDYKAAAAHLGVTVNCLRTWVHRKTVPHIRLSGRVVVFDVEQLDQWLTERSVPARGVQ